MEYLVTPEERAKLLLLGKRSLKKAGAPLPLALQHAKAPAPTGNGDNPLDEKKAPQIPASELLRQPDFFPSIFRRSTRIFAAVFALGHLFETVLPTLLRKQSFREALTKLRSTSPLRPALFLSSFSTVYRYINPLLAATLPRLATKYLPPRRVPSLPQVIADHDGSGDEDEERSTISSLRPQFRKRFRKLLLSPHVAPAVAGAVAAPTILLESAGQRRVSIALYSFLRSLQYGYNAMRDQQWWPDALKTARWFWGSHIVFALCNAQLLHTAVFHPDCAPEQYASILLRFSDPYLPTKPEYLGPAEAWPSDKQVVSAVGRMTIAKYPSFSSPLLHTTDPGVKEQFRTIKPVLDHLAHPAHSSLMCAVIHPKNISCSAMAKTAFKTNARKTSRMLAFLAALYLLPKRKQLSTNFEKVATDTFRLVLGGTAFLSLFTTLPWTTACLLQKYLPNSILPTRRLFIQGFAAGLPSMALPAAAVPELAFMASRLSLQSWWQVSKKQKRVKSRPGGEAIYFAVAAAVLGALQNYDGGHYIQSKLFRRGLDVLIA